MLTKIFLKLKRRSSTNRRIVTYPCAWCGTFCTVLEMRVVGLNDRKARVCKTCLK